MNFSLAERMAIAVLQKDYPAARALADLLLQDIEGGAKEVPPLAAPLGEEKPIRVSVERGRLRTVAYFPALIDGQPVAVDKNRVQQAIDNWLGNGGHLLLQGCEGFELYELPEWAVPKEPPSS